MVDILGRPSKHFQYAKTLDVMLSQLAGDPTQIPYIDAVAVQDTLELPTAQRDLLKVFEPPDDRLDVINSKPLAKLLRICQICILPLIIDPLLQPKIIMTGELPRDRFLEVGFHRLLIVCEQLFIVCERRI